MAPRRKTMKRFLAIYLAALAVVAMSQTKASAWSKCNFNIGLHISRESADNSLLWGLYRNGPHPFANNPAAAGHPGYAPDAPYPYYQPYGFSGAPANNPTLPAPGQTMPQAAAQGPAPYGQTATQPVGYFNYTYQYPGAAYGSWTPP